MDADVFAAHLDIAGLERAGISTHRFSAYSEFPPVMEDIAVVLADSVAGGEVLRAARDAGGDLVESVEVFDRYVGAPIEEGFHSLAIRLVFRAPDRTLTDKETASVRHAIVERLALEFAAVLRG